MNKTSSIWVGLVLTLVASSIGVRGQGDMVAAAQVVLQNTRGESLFDWLAAELPKRVPFAVTRTEWKGFSTTVPQLWVGHETHRLDSAS